MLISIILLLLLLLNLNYRIAWIVSLHKKRLSFNIYRNSRVSILSLDKNE